MASAFEKSKNDFAKEQHERECFERAVNLSHLRGGRTEKILTYLNGIPYEERWKNDRPDLVNICVKGKKKPTEVIVGIEHFEVNQLSKKSGKKIKSTGRELENRLWEVYDRGHKELLEQDMVSDENCFELSEKLTDLIQENFIRGYHSLIQALGTAVDKHLSCVDSYKDNLKFIANGRSVEMVFLIEFRSSFPQLFFNDGQHVNKKDDGLIPITTDIVKILSDISKSKVDYIILYMTNSSFEKNADVIAIHTGNVKNHLLAQRIKTYRYACENFYEGKPSKFKPTEIKHIDEKGLYRLNFCYEGLSDTEVKKEVFTGLQTAFYAKKKGIPFVTSRSVQLVLYAIGKYIRAFEPIGEYYQPVLSKQIPYGYIDNKYKEFEEMYGKIEVHNE